MKKISAGVVFVVLVFAGIWMLINRPSTDARSASESLPAGTVALVEFPDFPATARALSNSPLVALLRDPAIAPFLKRPAQQAIGSADFSEASKELAAVAPRSFFIAVTALRPDGIDLVAGFRYAGTDDSVAAALGRMHEWISESSNAVSPPTLSTRDGRRVFSQTLDGRQIESSVGGGWGIITNSPDAAADFLKSVQAGGRTESLAGEPVYKELARAHSGRADFLAFADLRPLIGLIESEALKQSARPIPGQLDALRKMRAGMYSSSCGKEGTVETATLVFSEPPRPESLKNSAMRFAPENTLFYYAATMDRSFLDVLSTGNEAPPEIAALLAALGISMDDIASAPGNEFGIFLWWPSSAIMPGAALSLDIADREKAGKLWQAVTLAGGQNLSPNALGDWQVLSYNQITPALVTPSLALGPDRLLATLTPGDLSKLLDVEKAGNNLSKSAAFQSAIPAYENAANIQFGFLDLPGVVRRAHAALGPVLGFAARMNPQVGENIDPDLLPSADAIAAHLGPVVSTQELRGSTMSAHINGKVTMATVLTLFASEAAQGFPMVQSTANPAAK